MKIKPIWLSLFVIVCFLFIHAGYNRPSDSLFEGLLWLIRHNGFTFTPDDLPLQFIAITIFLLTVSLLEKKALAIAGIIILMILLCFWMYALNGVIDFSLLSILPFFISAVISIGILVKKIQNENR